MEEADELRMETLKEIVLNILKPIQAVEYLEAAKRMRLCIGKWGGEERPTTCQQIRAVSRLELALEFSLFSVKYICDHKIVEFSLISAHQFLV